jgi:hypothetical protein
MRSCDYCGKENEDAVGSCAGCGCSLDSPKVSLSIPWTPLLSWGGLIFNIYVNASIVCGSLPEFYSHENIGPGIMIGFIGLFFTAITCFLIGIPCAILAIKKDDDELGGWVLCLRLLLRR